MTATLVRAATLDDADGIAAVHVAGWRAAYAGIVPQAHLDGLSVAKRAAGWRDRLSGGIPHDSSLWVAEHAGRVVGFANGGPSRDEDGAGLGEIRAIYVLPERWDTGTGRVLHDRTVAHLRTSAFPAATLWVLDANARARRFYERRGWRPDGTRKTIALGGADLPEVRYRLDLTATPAAGAGSNG